MKRKVVFGGVSGIMLLGIVGWQLLAEARQERQDLTIGEGYKVGDVVLKPGKYVVIHKDQGNKESVEACTFFYRAPYYADKDAVVKLRCRPSEGKRVNEFSMKASQQPDGTALVQSIQFRGSTEIHNLEPAL